MIVNSSGSLTCDENRLLFTFLDADNRPVGSPDRTASVSLFSLGRDAGAAVQTAAGTFVWGIENERGFYVAQVTFPEAGEWGAEFTTAVAGGAPETIRMRFEVATSSPVVRVGDPAPASDTPTGASVKGDLARLSTDPHPDPALYEQSVKGALAAHEPFVLIFATPKFCASAQCGPTLDRVKPLVGEFPSVRFIHVEPYELTFLDGALQPVQDAGGALIPAESVFEWGLLSEPWVFVVDRAGIVTASFEGVVGADELLAAVSTVK
ncbi:MAG: Thioredoxin protein [Chloroflexi bacterium]|nr:Thioredoxin protein [Chloroflexota bacterium]